MVFKFLRKIKKKKGSAEIEAAEAFPDITAQQLVQRFHSESALCDPSHRRILIEAAEETHAMIQLHQSTVSVKQRAVDSCRQLSQIESSITDLRASQQDIELRARNAQDNMESYRVPIREVLERQTQEIEGKIASLVQMSDMVQQAVESVEVDSQACVKKKQARSRSKARFRDGGDSNLQFGSCLQYEGVSSCMEFGRRVSVDRDKGVADLVKEIYDYLDETARTRAMIDTQALQKELADVKLLMEEYEESTRLREERLTLSEHASAMVM